MKNIYYIIASLLLIISCKKQSSSKENLALNLQKGFEQTLIYSTSTEGNKNGNMNDATEVKYRVDSTDKDGNYYLTGEILRMTYNQQMFDENIHFDSRDATDTDAEMGAEIRPIIHNPFSFKINKFGEIIGERKFERKISSDLDANQYNIIPFVFPKESVENGFMWTDEVANPLVKSMGLSNDYVYNGVKNNEIEITVFSKMSGMEGVIQDTNVRGKYIFDSKTKTLISAERTMPVQMGGGTASFQILSIQ